MCDALYKVNWHVICYGQAYYVSILIKNEAARLEPLLLCDIILAETFSLKA